MKTLLITISILLLLIAASTMGQNATVINSLTFGSVFPGIPETVSKHTAGAAAEFHISGNAGDEITIDFDLPRYINFGGYNMRLIFTETDCAIDTAFPPDQSNPEFDELDPWHTLTYRLGSNGLTIWLGGKIVPALSQPAGDYTADIVITVDTTGN